MIRLYMLGSLLLLASCIEGARARGLQGFDRYLSYAHTAAVPGAPRPATEASDPSMTRLKQVTAADRAQAWKAAMSEQIAAAADATCPAGQYFANGQCRKCPKGTFRTADDADVSRCSKCLAPYSTSSTGSTSADDCIVCPPGYGTPDNGPSCLCAPCAVGTYTAGGPAQLCTLCPGGLSTNSTGSTSIIDCTVPIPPPPPIAHSRCKAGQYWDIYTGTSGGCRDCNPGSFSTANTTNDTMCSQCYNLDAYSTHGNLYGATSSQQCTKCQAGYGRPLNAPSCVCMACPKGTYATGRSPVDGQSCTPCPANYTTKSTRSYDSSACIPINPKDLPTLEAQGQLLMKGKRILLGPGQKGSPEGMGTWTTDKYICYWAGVDCLNGLVEGIQVKGEKITGRLPEMWGQPALAATLQYLHIMSPAPGTQLSDMTIPAAWEKLIFLADFGLSGLNLTGRLPTRLPPNVAYLSLDNNKFTGTVPKSYIQLPLLQLDLSDNLLSGELPTYLSDILQLQYLSLGGNQFSGSLPAEWGALSNLNYLMVNNNTLTGSVPDSWAQLSAIHSLDISNNQLTHLPGPTFWTTQKTLAHFHADGNMFTSPLPDYMAEWVPAPSWGQRFESAYSTLSLNYNKFSGTLPQSWKAFKGDIVMNLAHNELSGPVPSEPWASVLRLDLSYNKLTGSLPASWKDWSVVILDLGHNQIKGPLPVAWNNWNSTETIYYNRIQLYLSNNPLGCSLPPEWSKWTNLQSLFVDNTDLTGTIPRSWTQFIKEGSTSLESFAAFDNPKLVGCVPKQPWVQLLWGPAAEDPSAGYTTGYKLYPFMDIKDQPILTDWPPFGGTNVTGLCRK